MGIIEGMVALGFLIVVTLVAMSMIPDLFGGLFDALGNTYTATSVQVRPEVDEIICDLYIKVNASLEQDRDTQFIGLFNDPSVIITVADSHDYTWYNCVARSQYTTNDLINAGGGRALLSFGNVAGLQTNDITGLFGDNELIFEIELVDSNDPSQRISSALQPQLIQEFHWKADQTIKTPADVSTEYVISDIPVRQYVLSISATDNNTIELTGINNLAQNEDFRTIICDEFSVREGKNCRRVQ